MSFDPWLLFGGFVFGTLGIYLIKEGRRVGSAGKVLIGISLLVYPYFLTSPLLTWVIGAVLFAASFKT